MILAVRVFDTVLVVPDPGCNLCKGVNPEQFRKCLKTAKEDAQQELSALGYDVDK